MRVSQYTAIEKAIATGTVADIRQRWFYGLMLLHDPEKMSSTGQTLGRGVAEKLVAAARSRGLELNERELRHRLQCARTYLRDSQVGRAASHFKTWTALVEANFPDFESDPDEPLADWRTDAEKNAAAKEAEALLNGQERLPFAGRFDPVRVTLKDLRDACDTSEQMTANFGETDRKNREYLDALIKAVDGDESKTQAEAHQAAYGEDIACD